MKQEVFDSLIKQKAQKYAIIPRTQEISLQLIPSIVCHRVEPLCAFRIPLETSSTMALMDGAVSQKDFEKKNFFL